MLILDEPTHTYWIDKVNYDSVTKIIEFLGLSRNYDGISSFYAERGKAAHKGVELVDKGTLDDSSVSEIVQPYIRGYREFLRVSGYEPKYTELMLHHPELRYAGTIDKVGILPKLGLGIMDVKTGDSIDPAVEDQLCAYEYLWNFHYPDTPINWKYALQLTADGKHNLVTKYSEAKAEDWVSIMKVYRKKQKRKY